MKTSKNLLGYLAVGILLLVTLQSAIAQYVTTTDEPSWLAWPDTTFSSEVNRYKVPNGYYYKSYLEVTNKVDQAYSVAYDVKLINRGGVDEWSQLMITFDTTYQRLQIHECTVIRRGHKIDMLDELEFRLLAQEDRASDNLFDGLTTASTVLQDIRVDDVLHVSYTLAGFNPLFADQEHTLFYLDGLTHIDRLSCRYITSHDESIRYRVDSQAEISVSDQELPKYRQIEVERYHVPPLELEETMSYSSRPFSLLEVTSHKDWSSVVKWGKKLFDYRDNDFVDSLVTTFDVGKASTPWAQETAVLDYLQNVVRYTSVNGGLGSFLPSGPAEVIDRNYGDCKDKAFILTQMLRSMGHNETYPALVNSLGGKHLDDFLPGPSFFDHVIVKSKIGDVTVWLDPTIPLQGGSILQRHSHDYGFALVMCDSTTNLERMKTDGSFGSTEVTDEIDISQVEGPGRITVTTVYKGTNAQQIRSSLNYYSHKEIQKSFMSTYSFVFADIQTKEDLVVKDDYDKNVVTTVETYTIPQPWQIDSSAKAKVYSIAFEPMNLYNHLKPIPCEPKKYTIDFAKNNSYSQISRFKLPEDALYKLDNFKSETPAYRFSKEQEIVSIKETVIKYHFEYISDELLPHDYPLYCKAMNSDSRRLLMRLLYLEPMDE